MCLYHRTYRPMKAKLLVNLRIIHSVKLRQSIKSLNKYSACKEATQTFRSAPAPKNTRELVRPLKILLFLEVLLPRIW